MEAILRALFLIFELFLRVLPAIKPMNPKILQDKYYEKHVGKLKELEKEIKNSSDKDIIITKLESKSLKNASRYAYRANLAWGRNIELQYKSVWFNVLAAEYHKLAGSFKSAGGHFHYAAHGFRELGEYDFAGRFYYKSTLSFKDAKEKELAIRACKRGISAYRQVEELSNVKKLEKLLKEL